MTRKEKRQEREQKAWLRYYKPLEKNFPPLYVICLCAKGGGYIFVIKVRESGGYMGECGIALSFRRFCEAKRVCDNILNKMEKAYA